MVGTEKAKFYDTSLRMSGGKTGQIVKSVENLDQMVELSPAKYKTKHFDKMHLQIGEKLIFHSVHSGNNLGGNIFLARGSDETVGTD